MCDLGTRERGTDGEGERGEEGQLACPDVEAFSYIPAAGLNVCMCVLQKCEHIREDSEKNMKLLINTV